VSGQIGTAEEAKACCTIARRGVMLVATAHGMTLSDVVDNPSLNSVVGGVESVILSDAGALARGSNQKTVRESRGPSAFGLAIELRSRSEWVVHDDVRDNVNRLLAGKPMAVEVRRRLADGRVVATRQLVSAATAAAAATTTTTDSGVNNEPTQWGDGEEEEQDLEEYYSSDEGRDD
jgi:hypothetical protein